MVWWLARRANQMARRPEDSKVVGSRPSQVTTFFLALGKSVYSSLPSDSDSTLSRRSRLS